MSWGFSAHKELHAVAISALPLPLYSFFKTHQSTLIEKSIAADRRKHNLDNEAEKHYIDLDQVDESTTTKETLPSTIAEVYNNLVYQMSMGNVGGDSSCTIEGVICISAD